MIRFYCNMCTQIIQPNSVNSVTIKRANREVNVMHFCPVCFPKITTAISSAGDKPKVKVEPKEPNTVETESVSDVEDTIDFTVLKNSELMTLEGEPPTPHGKTDVVALRRVLIGFYLSRDLKEISREVNIATYTVKSYISKYSSTLIAARYLKNSKRDEKVDRILKAYYVTGDVMDVADEEGVTVSEAISIVDWYTGVLVL